MPNCDDRDSGSEVRMGTGCIARSQARSGVCESFVPPTPVLPPRYECPASKAYSDSEDSYSDSYSDDDDDDDDGAGGGVRRRKRHGHGGRGTDGRRGRRGKGVRGRNGSRGRWSGSDGRSDSRGRDGKAGGLDGRGGPGGQGGRGVDGAGEGDREARRTARRIARRAERERNRYQPWTPSYISTVMLEKFSVAAALLMYIYQDAYRWSLLKSFVFFTYSIKTMFAVAKTIKDECEKKQKCLDMKVKYSPK